jgi:hypothetical protein
VLAWLEMAASPARLATGIVGAARHIGRAEAAIEAGAFKRARYETLAGAAAADRAAAALRGPEPLLDLGRRAPRLRRLLGEVPHLVAAAEHSAAAAGGSLRVARGALRGPDKLVVKTTGGAARVRVDRVQALTALLADVRTHLQGARAELVATDVANLPGPARPRIDAGIRKAEAASTVLSDALAGFRLLPAILGGEGPRLYLLAMQNPGELRGTGGSVLRFSLLAFDEGAPTLRPSKTVYKIDQDRRTLDVALPGDAWYVAGIEDSQRFGNANWSPDWPLSARLMLRYAQASDPDFPPIDGVIAVDPLLMRELMPGVGAFRLASHRQISQSKIVPYVLHRAYQLHPNPGLRRKHLKDLVDRFYRNLLAPAHPTELLEGLGAGLVSKHMQIYLRRRDEMSFVERMNWDGAIERRPGDYLFVVEQNVGGNKLDYSSRQTHTMDIELRGRDALVAVKVRVHNDVSLPQSNYWLGNSGPCHRPMINVYVPDRAELVAARAPAAGGPPRCSTVVRRLDTPAPAIWSADVPPEHRERGRKVWSATVEIPPRRSGGVRFDYRVPGVVTREDGRHVYRLTLQRQPKVWPDEVTIRLALPRGARAVHAPGWSRRADKLVWRRALTTDVALEVSWR